MKKIILPLLYLVFLTFPVLGQQVRDENLAIRTDESIVLDGQLNESIWEKAPEAETLLQINPYRQDPGKIKTSVKILYDDGFIYFGFLCSDSEPDNIKPGSKTLDGDLRNSDSVYILIDTSPDLTNFFYFAIDFTGSKSDGIIIKGERLVNYNWNGSWESFSQKTDFGWSTEVAINLSSIVANPEENRSFGVILSRVVPRLDISIFQPNPREPVFDVDELRNLEILELFEIDEQAVQEERIAEQIEQGGRAPISPYIMATLESGEKIKPTAGIEASYAFSPQMSGQLAVNPDFATVEPDFERVNLTPFELYLPEKRSFLQENSDIYQQPFRLFYSKRIGDIYGGVKLNGKYEKTEFSLVSAQIKKDEILNEGSANFSVLSFKKRNILNVLTIGVTAANRVMDKKNKGTAGVEAELKISESFKLSGQFALSYGDYGKNNTAFYIGPSFDSRTLHIHLHYKQIDKNFGDNANNVGFIPDDNRKELDSAINKTFLLRSGFLDRIRYRSNYNIYWGMDGTLRSWQIDEGLFFDTKKNFTLSVNHTIEYKLNEYILEPKLVYKSDLGGWVKLFTKDFRNSQTRFTSTYYAGERKQFSLFISAGKNYGSKFIMFGISKKIDITKNLFSEYDLYRVRYLSQSLYDSTFIHVLKLTLNIIENLSLKILWQKNSDIDKSSYHVVCSYAFKPPFGTIQLIYQKGNAEFGVKGTQGHTFFLRFGYTF